MADDGFDVAVVGAGIVGVTTALLAAEAGSRVLLVTADPVGGGTSGRSAGIVSRLHGTRYSRLARETAGRNAVAYRRMNDDGFALIEHWAERLAVPLDRRDAMLVALDDVAAARVDDEHLAARRAGLPVVKRQRPDLPFETRGALVLPDQLLLDPRLLLARMAAAAVERGVVLAEGERVLDVRLRPGAPVVLITDRGERAADHVVLATGTPVLDRGLYALKTAPVRQVAVGGPADPFAPLVTALWSRGRATVAVHGDGGAVAFGGAHATGTGSSEARRAADLERRAAVLLPGFAPDAAWSAQDYRPFNPIAFVGALPRGLGRVSFATGFDGWGLTAGAAAAIRLAAALGAGERPQWASVIGRRATRAPSLVFGVGSDARAAGRGVASMLRRSPADESALADGEGIVRRDGGGLVATSRIDGVVARVSGVCNRSGGVLSWNDLELSWDCPVCGARWTADGAVIEGGARGALPPAG